MIDILLATYNGEKYIDTQISSIVNQSLPILCVILGIRLRVEKKITLLFLNL